MNPWTDQFQQQQQDEYIMYTSDHTTKNDQSLTKMKASLYQPQLQFKLLQKPSIPIIENVKLNPVKIGCEQHFDKDFQSANLESVFQSSDQTFILYLSNDSNTKKYSQWFYFSCKNIKFANFIVKGFKKTDSLHNYGMKICICENGKWTRGGTKISYQKCSEGYQLKFSYKFNNTKFPTYFAYSFPYTYTEIKQYISQIQKLKLPFFNNHVLCKSYEGHSINCLSIGNQQNKDVIIILARTHSGETVSSYIIQGLINKLISNHPNAKLLRTKFLFKIIPMLNPDGVKNGNYRTSFTGNDLNRKWNDPSPLLHPEIYNCKNYIINLSKDKNINLILDLHGHSKKKNIFFYGCQSHSRDNLVRQFPYLMSKISNYFSYQKCQFRLQKQKNGTARICLYETLKLPFIYTMESSFCGNQNGQNYMILDYQKIGQKLLDGFILNFISNFDEYIKLFLSINKSNTNKSIQQKNRQKQLKQIFQIKQKYLSDIQKIIQQQKSLMQDLDVSDSSPQEGILNQSEILQLLKKNNSNKQQVIISLPLKDKKKLGKQKQGRSFVKQQTGNFRIRQYQTQSKQLKQKQRKKQLSIFEHKLLYEQKNKIMKTQAHQYENKHQQIQDLYVQQNKNNYNERTKLLKLLMIQRNCNYNKFYRYFNKNMLNNTNNAFQSQPQINLRNKKKTQNCDKMILINQFHKQRKYPKIENLKNKNTSLDAKIEFYKQQKQLKIIPGKNCKKITQKTIKLLS